MNTPPFPNEPTDYRTSRNKLLEAEAALRTQLEKVAAMRRALLLGGRVKENYVFEEIGQDGEVRPVRFSDLFHPEKNSLFLYGFMFGPNTMPACPLCTSFLDSLNGNAPHLNQRVNVAVVARSPIERIREFADSRGWSNLRVLSSAKNTYQFDYLAEDDKGNQWPMANVFVKQDGAIHHFWGSELLFQKYEGGDMRHVDLLWPLWNILDLTPEGRGDKWYPARSYAE